MAFRDYSCQSNAASLSQVRASAVQTPPMGVKIVVDQAEPIRTEILRLRRLCLHAGVPIGSYVRLTDRNRRKDYYEKPGVKRRRRKHIAQMKQAYFERRRRQRDWNSL